MEESLLADELFRRSLIVSMVIGILCRAFVLRVSNKQYPSRPQDYLEQIIISGLAASLGAIVYPALIDKEFAALTFFAVAIQQFQGLSDQERITIENIDKLEIVPKGTAYIEEVSSTYESRSYISLFSALAASITYITLYRMFDINFFECTIAATIAGSIVALIFRRFLRRDSISDIAEVKEAKLEFDGPLLKVNNIIVDNIGLEDTRKKYMSDGIAIEIVPKSLGDFGIINDLGQREAILHNIYLHVGINKDVDEKDIVATSRADLQNNSIVIPYIPLKKDIETIINVVLSTPVVETSKGRQSVYKKKGL